MNDTIGGIFLDKNTIHIELDFMTIVDSWRWQTNTQTGERRLILQLRNMKGNVKSKETYMISLDEDSGNRYMTFLGMLKYSDPRLQ